jgi:hypothetical protein
LNPRPSDYKSDALPTELRQQSETTGPRGRMYPSDPFQMSGTIVKGTITVIWVQLEVAKPYDSGIKLLQALTLSRYFVIFHTVP